MTITTTYGDLAKVIALFCHSNGKNYGDGLYYIAYNTLEGVGLNPEKAKEVIPSGRTDILKYYGYQDTFIDIMGFQPQENEEQKRIRELEETIQKAQQQLQELKKAKENR